MGIVRVGMPFEKIVVIDARGHLLGRLASFVAKEALLGQKVVVVRCEELVMGGSFIRNKLKLLMKRNKRMNTNPKKGPFHHRSPADMFLRVVRGMLPHKHYRGSAAFQRIKTLEGVLSHSTPSRRWWSRTHSGSSVSAQAASSPTLASLPPTSAGATWILFPSTRRSARRRTPSGTPRRRQRSPPSSRPPRPKCYRNSFPSQTNKPLSDR